MIDVRLAPGAPVECLPVPAVLLLHGLSASKGYDEAITAGPVMRFYLLDRGDDVVTIEVVDNSGGDRIEEYDAVAKSAEFVP